MEESHVKSVGFACLVFDIVDMDAFNRTNGWEAGDRLIQSVFEKIEAHFASANSTIRSFADEVTVMVAGGDDPALIKKAAAVSCEIELCLRVIAEYGFGLGFSVERAKKSAIEMLFQKMAGRRRQG